MPPFCSSVIVCLCWCCFWACSGKALAKIICLKNRCQQSRENLLNLRCTNGRFSLKQIVRIASSSCWGKLDSILVTNTSIASNVFMIVCYWGTGRGFSVRVRDCRRAICRDGESDGKVGGIAFRRERGTRYSSIYRSRRMHKFMFLVVLSICVLLHLREGERSGRYVYVWQSDYS